MPVEPAIWKPSYIANPVVAGQQDQIKTFRLANGDYWVSWRDFGDSGLPTTAGSDIFGQRYNALGEALGGPTRLNHYENANNENSADFAVWGSNFFLAYENTRLVGGYADIILERHLPDGTPSTFRIPAFDPTGSNTGINLFDPQVAVSSDTNAVVVWERRNGSTVEFVARFFNPNTMVLGPEVVIATSSGGQLYEVIALPDGSYALAYEEFVSATQFDILIKKFNQSGAVLFTYARQSPDSEAQPSIVVLNDTQLGLTFTETR